MSCSPSAGALSRAYVQMFPSLCFGSPMISSTFCSVIPAFIFLNCSAREELVVLWAFTFCPEAVVRVQANACPDRRAQHKSATSGRLLVICCGKKNAEVSAPQDM